MWNFWKLFFLPNKSYPVSYLRRLVLNQSSPVQPISESRGVGLSITKEQTDEGQKSLCQILDELDGVDLLITDQEVENDLKISAPQLLRFGMDSVLKILK